MGDPGAIPVTEQHLGGGPREGAHSVVAGEVALVSDARHTHVAQLRQPLLCHQAVSHIVGARNRITVAISS